VTTLKSAPEALGLLDTKRFEAIVKDIMMPGMDGMAPRSRVRQHDRELPVIILTGHPTLESVVMAVKEGSFTLRDEAICSRKPA
jgi:DNA-binding NtrC family response regulator